MQCIDRVKNVANTMKHVSEVSMGLLVFIYGFMWMYPDKAAEKLANSLPGINQPGVSDTLMLAGFGLSLIPFVMLLYGLYNIRQLLALYAQGDLFPEKAGLYLQRFGIALFFLGPVQIIIRALGSLVFSLHDSTQQGQLVIEIASNDVVMLLIGGLIFVVGKVSMEATRVAEENRQFL